MKKLFTIFILLLSFNAYAADYYVAQTAAGSGDGSTCGNADAIANLTWGTGNMVHAGDTLHLCGTLTSTLTIGASGSEGSPIIVKFETSSKLSKAYWGTESSAAIYASNRSYITIDGNSTGIIENTANGDELANQQNSRGIDVTGGTNWEIKNLTIQNIYVHVYNNSSAVMARAISFSDTSTVSVHNNVINNAYFGVIAGTSSISVSDLNIYSNTISACSTAIVTALGNSGTGMDTVNIHDNTIAMGLNWYDTPNSNHVDGIHVWAISSGTGAIGGLKIYNNYIYGNPGGHCTSFIYMEYDIINPLVYNNLLVGDTQSPANGYISCHLRPGTAASNLSFLNNTIVGISSDITGKQGIYTYTTNANTTVTIKNNIIKSVWVAIYDPEETATMASDYNDIYDVSYYGWRAYGYTTLSAWRAVGNDIHSISADPKFVSSSNFSLQSDSPAINVGTDLSASFTTDLLGNTRPTGIGTWDIGAYEYGATGGDTTPPTVSSATISANGTDLVIVFNENITATDNAAFTVDPTGADVTVDCPAVATATTTMTCVISREILYSEIVVYGYTGSSVVDGSANALATISNTPSVINNSTVGIPSIPGHSGGIFGGCVFQ